MFVSSTLRIPLVLLLIFFVTTVAFAAVHKEVIIEDNGKEMRVATFAGNVEELLKQEGIKLNPGDKVTPGLKENISEGSKIVISRGFDVNIILDEEEYKTVKTTEMKVKDILKNAGIKPGSNIIVKPSLNTVIKEEATIDVTRIITKEVVTKEEIPYETHKKRDGMLQKGKTRIVQKGARGIKELTYRVTVAKGKVIDRELVKVRVLKEPVPEIVAVGTQNTISRGGNRFRYKKVMDVIATAYTHTGSNTATGKRPGKGTVAVDPSVIPLGSRLYVEGYGFGVAQDVGSKIKGSKIDVFLESRNAALKWGRKRVKVYILE
ncbi:MAG: DUF348 domain-containing protein [Clostridia bacterium]|nr:DUF348 domain-containing protein [Clostridia bacterium]